MRRTDNLYSRPGGIVEEFSGLLSGKAFLLEQITSWGQASPPDFWYDQPGDEWVLLARGTSVLEFGDGQELELKAGDYLLIPARDRHRVKVVSEDAVWLALHFVP